MWFRQDLRLHDNEALRDALEVSEQVIPVYVFDERVFKGKTRYGFPKTNKFRANFIIESIKDLKKSLQNKGSDLIIRVGKPEDEIYKIAKEIRTNWVFCNRERTQEESDVQDVLEKKLWSIGQEIRYSRGKMLYYTADLPFPVSQTPDTFAQFKKEVEKIIPIRKPLSVPETLPTIKVKLDKGNVPELSDFGFENIKIDNRRVYEFKGGETAALERLTTYFWDKQDIAHYNKTKDGLIGDAYSSKFSPWLSQGCISPKMIYHELNRYFKKSKNKKAYQSLFYELMWRDYLRLMGKKHGNLIFQKGGVKQESPDLKSDMTIFNLWQKGRTGIPFVDANINELNNTGFISNKGRIAIASFLVKELKINWQMGAEYFESMLLDYDPCSNWGNWNYIAGVGAEHKEDRHLNIISQAKHYDPNGEYTKLWLPQLKNVPNDCIHCISNLDSDQLLEANVRLGVDYPKAMIQIH